MAPTPKVKVQFAIRGISVFHQVKKQLEHPNDALP